MPLLKERGHPWYWNEAFLVEIFCWIKPKSKSDIWAHSNKKAMLDAWLLLITFGISSRTSNPNDNSGHWSKMILKSFLYFLPKLQNQLTKNGHNFSKKCTANPFPVMTTGISLCSNSHREFPVMNTCLLYTSPSPRD